MSDSEEEEAVVGASTNEKAGGKESGDYGWGGNDGSGGVEGTDEKICSISYCEPSNYVKQTLMQISYQEQTKNRKGRTKSIKSHLSLLITKKSDRAIERLYKKVIKKPFKNKRIENDILVQDITWNKRLNKSTRILIPENMHQGIKKTLKTVLTRFTTIYRSGYTWIESNRRKSIVISTRRLQNKYLETHWLVYKTDTFNSYLKVISLTRDTGRCAKVSSAGKYCNENSA